MHGEGVRSLLRCTRLFINFGKEMASLFNAPLGIRLVLVSLDLHS